jgi:beta-mannosidase
MMWMYNDCWPTSNWSIIDYYRRPKPSYYAAKRACATLLPIIFERNGSVEFFFSNDGAGSHEVRLVFGQERLDGSPVWSQADAIRVGCCDTVRFHSLQRADLELESGDYLFIDAVVDGERLPRVTYFPGLWKDVEWPVPNITVDMLDQKEGGSGYVARLKVETDAYARLCHLVLPDQRMRLEDSFFDLCAGHSRTITLSSPERIDLSTISIGHWHTDWP